MGRTTAEEQRERFEEAGQGHVFDHWDALSGGTQDTYLSELEGVDLELVQRLRELALAPAADSSPKLEPPEVFPLAPTGADLERTIEARAHGAELLAVGAVGFVLVAGGQGSRLGFDGPKGAFEIGPIAPASLFAWHAARIQAAAARHGFAPRWYVMTSAANDEATRAYFDLQGHFGLPPSSIFFFRQDMLPALDAEGRIVLARPGALFLAPNGHGGTLAALASSGALEDMRSHAIEQISYFQVDNPLARPGDTLFLGLHDIEGAEMSSKVVSKRNASEKVGVLGRIDGRLGCIEYSDLSDELRNAKDGSGALLFSAGNIAAHAIRRDFVEALTAGGDLDLPWHVARKKIGGIDAEGNPAEIDGVKFETFVFDALGRTTNSIVLEVDRAEEFSPVKNAEGSDSPASCRADLLRIGRDLAGAEPDESVHVDPRVAETRDEFQSRTPVPEATEAGRVYRP
ncbi:MAG: UTP--glucose-1-phosphate uridylyltransferase [Planctomycetota bacterium]